MKKFKKIALASLFIFGLVSCNNNDAEENNDLEYLNNILDLYNANESLSLNNYLANKLDLPIYNDNTFIYKNNIYKIGDEITCDGKNSTNYDIYADNFDELKEYSLGTIAYVESVGYPYLITDTNKGLDVCISDGVYATPVIDRGVCNAKVFGLAENVNNSTILQNIFNSLDKYNINYLEIDEGNYHCDNNISLSDTTDLVILAHNAKLIVNDSFNDEVYHEFFFNIYNANNLMISRLDINYQMTRKINGIKTELAVHNSNNIEIVDCSYDIPATVDNSGEFTNMDLYTHWNNVIINRCSFNNVCDSEAGGSLWIRDFHGNGSSNCKVLNSYFYKIAHDEMIAVFMGKISDVLIENNEFIVPDDGNSSSVMNFTFGTSSNHENISFINNKADVCSTGGLIWAKGKNVVVKDNELNVHLSSKGAGNFRVIEGTVNNVSEVSNNRLSVDSYLDSYDFQIHILHNVDIVKNNKIIINLKTTDILLNVNEATDNEIEVNKETSFIFYNIYSLVKNNIVNLNNAIGSCIFRYYGRALDCNCLITKNTINYNYIESEDGNTCFIMLNDLNMNNYRVDIISNNITALGLSKKSRFLFYAPYDEDQKSIVANNEINGYNINNNYFKKCEISWRES